MVQNIAIVGFDRQKMYEVAKLLSEELNMHFFDCLELFEFDNVPRDFATMLKEYGESHYRDKEAGMLKYVSGFNDCVINLEWGFAELEKNFNTIKENCLLIYLHTPASKVKMQLGKKQFNTLEEKVFFNIEEERVKARIRALKKGADIIVVTPKSTALGLCSDIVRQIKAYYNI